MISGVSRSMEVHAVFQPLGYFFVAALLVGWRAGGLGSWVVLLRCFWRVLKVVFGVF